MNLGINMNSLSKFVKETLNVGDTIDAKEAKDLGVEDQYNDIVGEDADEVSVDIALEDDDFMEAMTEIYVETKAQQEQENTTSEEEKNKKKYEIKDKNAGTGV